MSENEPCYCAQLGELAIIGMGDADRLDERVFAPLDIVLNYGDDKWWLYI